MVDIAKLKERYDSIFGSEPCSDGVITRIESALGVQVPTDFIEITSFYSGGFLGGISHHEISFSGDATNIVQETLRLRESLGLSERFVVIAEPSESLIVLNVTGCKPAVIWCDAVDAQHINTSNFTSQPDTWDSYGEFFDYLLDEEEDA